jgi:hypothetical protein
VNARCTQLSQFLARRYARAGVQLTHLAFQHGASAADVPSCTEGIRSQETRQAETPKRRPRTWAPVVALIAAGLAFVPWRAGPTPANNYVLLASALCHGRLWIDWPGPRIDAVAIDHLRYIVNDPVPALLLVPAVWIFGTATNQTLLDNLLGAVAAAAAWRTCEVLAAPRYTTFWLVAVIFVGTDLWWASALGDVWFLAQTSAFAFLMLCLLEIVTRNRGWIVGVTFALAVGSRFTEIMALPAIVYLVAVRGPFETGRFSMQARRSALVSLCGVLAFATTLWMLYNRARWGVPWDSGHTLFYHQDPVGAPTGSPFGLQHVGYQLHSFLIQGPRLLHAWPWIMPRRTGLALTWTSPVLLLALLARRPASGVIALWVAAVLVAIPSLLYYVNGYEQFGMRHALDFEPFLFVLMILALRERRTFPIWAEVLCAYSVLVGIWGVWAWRYFFRPV